MADFLLSLLAIFILALLVILVASPFESLQWWAGWVKDEPAPATEVPSRPLTADPVNERFVVFLPGVGAMGTSVDPWEQRLVDRLHAGLDRTTLLAGLFPFTVLDNTLLAKRRTAWLWRQLAHIRDTRPSLVATLIDWRNLTQVFVSMDPRYGPIYNTGVERKLLAVLVAQGYRAGCGAPITLIGYSGGAQIALGASLYLEHDLRAPVSVISLGGVLGDDPALETVDHLYHLWGTKDQETRLAKLVVPARWRMSTRSRWNRALTSQRLVQICLGSMRHTGPNGYLDPDATGPDGRSYLELTAEAMLHIINQRPDRVTDPGPPWASARAPVGN